MRSAVWSTAWQCSHHALMSAIDGLGAPVFDPGHLGGVAFHESAEIACGEPGSKPDLPQAGHEGLPGLLRGGRWGRQEASAGVRWAGSVDVVWCGCGWV